MRKVNLKQNDYGGKLIVFEGIDGSGKTTLLNSLKEYLQKSGFEVESLKMPSDRMRNLKVFDDYDNNIDSSTRDIIDLTNLTIMVSGDRLLLQDEIVIPALKQNKIVLCDRYCWTGLVKCQEKIIYDISKRFVKPNLTFLCDVSIKTAKERIEKRQNEKNNYYNKNSVYKERNNFLSLAKKNGFQILNTNQQLDRVEKQIFECVKAIL